MEALSATVMLRALDGLSMRQIATAQNIANAGTPNYRPVRVSFEEALRAAAGQGEEATHALSFHVEPQPVADYGPEMRLDLETATASTTAARYAGLIEILGRQMQINALAISGGR